MESYSKKPHHYTQGILPGECIDYVKYLDFCRGNVIKYLWRYENKNGQGDIKKAAHYLDYIERSPYILVGQMPQDVLEEFNSKCHGILESHQVGTKIYDFVSCIYILGNIDPCKAHDNDVVLAAHIYKKVVEKHID